MGKFSGKRIPAIIGLKELDLPVVSSKEWYELNHSYDNNYIINNNGNVTIKNGDKSGKYSFEINEIKTRNGKIYFP